MMRKMSLFFLIGLSICLTAITCSKSTDTEKPSTGAIRVFLADKSASYDAVNIEVSQVSVHKAVGDTLSGWIVICDTIQKFDLLTLRNGAMVLFADHPLDTGYYTQIRLQVTDACSVIVDGVPYSLEIPSGYQTGIKINHPFQIQGDVTYELLLDFDAEKSIHQLGNDEYQMKPVIRAVAVATSGSISGLVDPDSIQAYALADLDTVAHTHSDLTGYFKLVGLPAGSYAVKIVPDDTDYADSLLSDVVVVAGETTDLGSIQLREK